VKKIENSGLRFPSKITLGAPRSSPPRILALECYGRGTWRGAPQGVVVGERGVRVIARPGRNSGEGPWYAGSR